MIVPENTTVQATERDDQQAAESSHGGPKEGIREELAGEKPGKLGAPGGELQVPRPGVPGRRSRCRNIPLRDVRF